jgi:Na+-translocating ferredoxin:NAD+ oxidoreductase RnfD subunit
MALVLLATLPGVLTLLWFYGGRLWLIGCWQALWRWLSSLPCSPCARQQVMPVLSDGSALVSAAHIFGLNSGSMAEPYARAQARHIYSSRNAPRSEELLG